MASTGESAEPRVPQLRLEDLDEEARAAWDYWVDVSNMQGVVSKDTSLTAIASVLLYNPGVYLGTCDMSLQQHGGIPARERELIMLRTAWRCQAKVPWSNHSGHAHALGMTPEEIERISVGPDAEGWSASDRALLRMVDELHDTARISDGTWAQLEKDYDRAQLVTLPMIVGAYHQVAFTFNALRVPEPDPARGGLTAR